MPGGDRPFGKGRHDKGKGKGRKGGPKPPAHIRGIDKVFWRTARARDPDDTVNIIHAESMFLLTEIKKIDSAQLERLLQVLDQCGKGLRYDKKEQIFTVLSGNLMSRILRFYIPDVYSNKRLELALRVVLELVKADAASCEPFFETSSDKVQAALERCPSDECRFLWEEAVARVNAEDEPGRQTYHRQRRAAQRVEIPFEDEHIENITLTPPVDDLLQNDIRIPENRGGGQWELETEERNYKQTHFLLLREEMLDPLREAVISFFKKYGGADFVNGLPRWAQGKQDQGQRHFAYENAKCVGFLISKSGNPCAKFSFSCKNRVDFSLGSHLIYGSLVILFVVGRDGKPQKGSELYATVEEFDLKEIRKGKVGLTFVDHNSWQKFNVSQKYIMLESPSYFHAVQPVLKWLQNETYLRECPLAGRLLSGQVEPNESRATAPEYLKHVMVDISCLYKRDLPKKDAWIRASPLNDLPNQDDIELDPSQLDAFTHTMHSPVAVVQGPPGTGKSYVGVKITKICRQALEKSYGDEAGPIIVVCLTNHALDQFLEDLLEAMPGKKLLRFGGMSRSENQRLLDCMVTNHLETTYTERQERDHTRDEINLIMEQAEKVQASFGLPWRRLQTFLALCPPELLYDRLISQLNDEVVECALCLHDDPMMFLQSVLEFWKNGVPLREVSDLLREKFPSGNIAQRQDFTAANRFAALDEDQGSYGTILSDIDMQVSQKQRYRTPAMARSAVVRGQTIDPEDDEFIDEDDVENILLERQDVYGREWTQKRKSKNKNNDTEKDYISSGGLANTWQMKKKNLQQELMNLKRDSEVAKRDAELAQYNFDYHGRNPQERSQAERKRRECEECDRQYQAQAVRWKPLRKRVQKEMILDLLKMFFARFTTAVRTLKRGSIFRPYVPDIEPDSDYFRESDSDNISEASSNQHVVFGDDEIDELERLRKNEGFHDALSWNGNERERTPHFDETLTRASDYLTPTFHDAMLAAERGARILAQIKKVSQQRPCKTAAVVGMTSTFAAVNRDLLQRLGARVVIVEEAGELLESQLMACLSSRRLEHVVMIGDHQQLRPKVNTYNLAKNKQFDISLFERLVNVRGGTVTSLTRQLRMHPDVSALVSPFYRQMEDHPRVLDRAMVPGISDRLFWVSHNVQEDGYGNKNTSTKSNTHEAEFAVRLAMHFVYNGMEPQNITILTPYQGQKRKTRQMLDDIDSRGDADSPMRVRLLPKWVDDPDYEPPVDVRGRGKGKGPNRPNEGKKFIPGIKCVTIDDYQGEENDIIILPLVRSNPDNKLGFCKIDNRIIVALSRARRGMFILGDAEMFRTDANWKRVQDQLEAKNRVGERLNLSCSIHPNENSFVATAEDFKNASKHGGCHRKCDSLLAKCGHKCPLHCHPGFDQEHMETSCVHRCTRPRVAGCDHPCKQMCKTCTSTLELTSNDINPRTDCRTPCQEKVIAQLPCGHEQQEPCYMVTSHFDSIKCRTLVSVILPCGHRSKTQCWQTKDEELIRDLKCTHREKVKAPCGHEVWKNCNTVEECKKVCEKKSGCGDLCTEKCSVPHDHSVTCGRECKEILFCGHKCQKLCGQPCTVICEQKCTRKCVHGNKCPKKCFEECVPCHQPSAWQCRHKQCTKRCFEESDRERCDEPCDKQFKCGCICKGLCGEPCPPCPRHARFKNDKCPLSLEKFKDMDPETRLYQLECGHIFSVDMLDMHFAQDQDNNGHQSIQAKTCPLCRAVVYTAPRYGNQIKRQLKMIDKIKSELRKKHGPNLREEERREINAAMMGDRREWVGGHWYACPKGHPYFIGDCGAAMVESKCPECGLTVGGGSHSLRSDNRHLADFTGDGPQENPFDAARNLPIEQQLRNMRING